MRAISPKLEEVSIMGSGISGKYSGTIKKSQPYSNLYSVCDDLLDLDKKDQDIYNPITGYFKNPTATNLLESIIGNGIYRNGKRIDGTITYVMAENGNIIFGARQNPNNPGKRSPHPTLIGGRNPKVQCAGMITFSKGKIVSIDNKSGHFKPNIMSMKKIDDFMKKLYDTKPEIFSVKSKWRKK